MTKKLQLEYAEFYITNSCNFNCTGCNRFNNYNFVGTQLWSDYEKHYQQWADILDIDFWTIIGGEPMMNPSYMDWLENISRLWPNSRGRMTTNGYFLQASNRRLYEIFKNSNGLVKLEIGLHNVDRQEQVLDEVKKWLRGDITVTRWPTDLRSVPDFDAQWKSSYDAIRDPAWPACDTVDAWDNLPQSIKQECEDLHNFSPELVADQVQGWELCDSHGVRVAIKKEDFFYQGALIPKDHRSFYLHNSDPEQAHSVCSSKTCHHFDKGKLYKCGQVALFKEFDQQFYLELSQADRDLIYAYQPADPEQDWSMLENFINNIKNPLPQCKFCPGQYHIKQVVANHGQKIKIEKKPRIQIHET
jgi:organic radical activating enzyme